VATVDLIVRLFCRVDDRLGPAPKHRQARLWPSQLVTIGLLFALKGGSFRAFYRWPERDHAALFGGLPERTRLLRALAAHRRLADRFLADPTFLTVIDTYGIPTLHPWRYRRTPRQLGVKGWCNHRWVVGLKLCWLINDRGEVVAWSPGGASASDHRFLPLVARLDGRTVTLAERGFGHGPVPPNLKPCRRGHWDERMVVETALSLVHRVCGLGYLGHRAAAHAEAHLADVAALFNALINLDGHPDHLAIARFSV
jgi:hypothetical protein